MARSVPLSLLAQVRIAAPCPARWEDMAGDDRVRHCAQCDLKVHNLSAMTEAEAESVLRDAAGGRLCAGFYRRADGTVLPRDCPVGLAAVRARARAGLARVAAAIGLLITASIAAEQTGRSTWGSRVRLRGLEPVASISRWLAPAAPTPPPLGRMTMTLGVICSPSPPSSPAPSPPQEAPTAPESSE